MFRETAGRSILKAFSWRVSGTIATAGIVYFFTGRIKVAAVVGGFEFIGKMLIFFLHERFWDKVPYGRKEIVPFVVWFTGLPSSGKNAVADEVHRRLKEKGFTAERLSGSRLRSLLPETGFSEEARNTHIRRVGILASILEKNKVTVIASFVSPYAESRKFARGLCNNFIEVYVATPRPECEKRDTQGLYAKARNGQVENFTGVNAPYDVPAHPEIIINTAESPPEKCADAVMDFLYKRKWLQ
ncbi:MAG: adenylyl-sulfate kinase [Candidatus Omnitrophica bacterium]|nr:adenylyl-sulfate kinase [Candidatus Omnitrophota bacterium]